MQKKGICVRSFLEVLSLASIFCLCLASPLPTPPLKRPHNTETNRALMAFGCCFSWVCVCVLEPLDPPKHIKN